jgi:sulfate transport system permease protein
MSRSSIMPGFRPTIGFTLIYLGLVVLIPLSTLVFKSFELNWDDYVRIITNKRVLSSFRVSFSTALAAALIASFFGFIVAWVLVRYAFFGKRFFHAIIDFPFALPTAVAGIVLATIFQPSGFLGKLLMDAFGVQVAFKPLGIVMALIFISIPLSCALLSRYCWSLNQPWRKPHRVWAPRAYKSLAKLFFRMFSPL